MSLKEDIEKIRKEYITSAEVQELVQDVEALQAKFQETGDFDLLDYKPILAKASSFIQNSAAQKLNERKSRLYEDIATYLTSHNVAAESIMGEFKHVFESNIQRLSDLILEHIEINDPIIAPFANQANINGYDVLDKINALIKTTLQESRGQLYGDFEEDLEDVIQEYLFEDEELSSEFERRGQAALEIENGLLFRLTNNSSLISQIQKLDSEIKIVKTQITAELRGYLDQRGVKDFKQKSNEFNFFFLDGQLKKEHISPLEDRKKELVQEAIDQILSRKEQEHLPSGTRSVITSAITMISSGQKSVKTLSDEDSQKFIKKLSKQLSETLQLFDSLKPEELEPASTATPSGSTLKNQGLFAHHSPQGPNGPLPLVLEALVKRLLQLEREMSGDIDKKLETILKSIVKKQTPEEQMKIFSDDRISYDFFKKIKEVTDAMIDKKIEGYKKEETPSQSADRQQSIEKLCSLSILFLDIDKPNPDANYDI